MSSQTLLIRADANVEIGTGHVMRCLALAQAWQDRGGDVVFAMAESNAGIDERLRSEQARITKLDAIPGSVDDAAETARLARSLQASWTVVDGYRFDSAHQCFLKDEGLKLLVLDDYGHAHHYWADVVLNQNISANESMYASREKHTRLCLGLEYVLLRREFKPRRNWKREISLVAKKVLVTMGGSDPENVTSTILRAMRQVDIDGLELMVIVGGGNPHGESLEKEAAHSGAAVSLRRNVANFPELMSWADIAISASGSTCWELCFLGLPAALIDLAANQRSIARALDQDGISVHLGSSHALSGDEIAAKVKALLLSHSTRGAMSEQARGLVDGRGADRIVSILQSLGLRLRPAEHADCRMIWDWASDQDVRAVSFSGQAIGWEQHVQWFHAKLRDKNSIFFVATDLENVPIGQVRYDLAGTHAVVSVSLASRFRGKGYGTPILNMAAEELFSKTVVTAIDAYVKPSNEASLRLFTKAGFSPGGPASVGGQFALHFTLQKRCDV
jgi:UDP-2,4-diacetamido-2,4,6-trideoxy-beta-L-altropyranose hydrolase